MRLHIAASETLVAGLPWEFLYDPDLGGPVALLGAPIMRYLPQPTRIPSLAAELPLKVLLTAAQTPPPVNVERELREVERSLAGLGQQVQIVLEPHLTRAKFQQFLRQSFHIWHFVGHGGFSSDGITGRLMFEDAMGDVDHASASELRILLQDSGVRLIVLDACQGARLATDPFRSLAPALIQAQIPAVVAMQFSVPEEATRAFAAEFYRTLAEGWPIDACVSEGRKAVMNACGLHRPDWGIPVLYSRAADGRLFVPAAERAALLHADSQSAETALLALSTLIEKPEFRAAVVSFEADFADVCARIETLVAYKRLHDLFQELDSCYGIIYHFIYDEGRLIPQERLAWTALERNEPELAGTIERVLEFGGQAPFASETALWRQKLQRARDELQVAIEDTDTNALKTATRRIADVLGREPSRVNTNLVTTAADLRLSALVRALNALRDHPARRELGQASATRFAAVYQGSEALSRLNEHLAELVARHNTFQIIDDELRRIETLLEQDFGELEFAWPDLRPLAHTLCQGAPAAWATKLITLGDELDLALAARNTGKTVRLFRSYRSQASRAFNQVDRELLALCEELQKVGEPLTAVLKVL
jgi:HPt (histidine-containing phosphotransfer) domain-containing protein